MPKKAKIRLVSGFVKPKTIKIKGWKLVEKEPIIIIDKSLKNKKLY